MYQLSLASLALPYSRTGPVLLVLAMLLGLRHGIDWDHIAAIADLTSSQARPRTGVLLGALYAAGHSVMLLTLGGVAVLLGATMPEAVERFTEPVVGLTLLLLGTGILASVLHSGRRFRLRSRWMLVLGAALRGYDWLREIVLHRRHVHREWPEQYSRRAAFAMGLLHGVGVESPTQVLLFATAAELGGRVGGVAVLFAFVLGLLCSNSGLSLASTMGYMHARNNGWIAMLLGALTGAFSVGIGALFLLGHGSLLPSLLGG